MIKALKVESDLIDPTYSHVILRDMSEVQDFLGEQADMIDMPLSQAIAEATITEIEMDEAEFAALEPYDP